ncbi:reverse transcriptase domain-containing protein [Tanacetum coccineum]
MADHLRPMEELLRILTKGIEDAIVIPAVLADQFELKPELLDFISNNSFFGLENDDPHSHIRRFYQITRTLRLNQVPDDVLKLILFLFSLKGAAESWLENEPPCSITTWDDLVSKFLNRFYPHSKTREFRKEITNFQQVFGETFTEAWERFKDLLRKCPHHGFSLIHQVDFFYNGLSQFDQDFLNTTAGGNLMSKNTHEALTIIENKAKVRTCRNKPQVLSSGGISNQNDAITALTKQVEALISSMQEAYNQNQEASIQLMQNQMDEELEPETITEVVEIASSKSKPLIPPSETLPLSVPKPKEDLEPNPYQPPIPCPSQLQEEKFHALENLTGRADHFVYRIDIVDSLCDKFPIKNNSLSGNPTPSSDLVVESFSPSPIPYEDSDSLRRVVAVPLLILIILFRIIMHSILMTIILKRRVVAVPLLILIFLFWIIMPSLPFPPADRTVSHYEEFTDELTHIMLGINLHKLVLLVQELNTSQDITNSTNRVSTARRKVSTASTELNTVRED